MIQRPGYPNISIKLYESYDAWKENRFLELGATFTTLTLRDGLNGRNEGVLQFYDNKNLHTKMDGDQIIQISLANANTKNVQNRIYGCKHFSASVDSKGDNIIAIQLAPYHVVKNIKFSRLFFGNATESITEMIRAAYLDAPLLAPKIDGINVHVPNVVWSRDIQAYMQYVREVGLSVDQEQFVFAWEDITGIHLLDYDMLISQDPFPMVVGDPRLIGELVSELEVPLAYNFQWTVKGNQYARNPYKDATFFTYSIEDQSVQKLVTGNGTNAVYLSRSGGYADMTYRNGYEEALRLCTMSQYDGYAQCQTAGNFEITPGLKVKFGDTKDQFKTDFYVDEVIHEIANNVSVTNLFMFTNCKPLEEVNLVKVKNEITNPAIISGEEVILDASQSTVDRGEAEWDLDVLSNAVTAGARNRFSTGQCALFVRRALEKAQIKKFFSGGLGHANQVGPKLLKYGWFIVGQNVTKFEKGDIAIFQQTTTVNGKKYGHICVWTGQYWVSDFIQGQLQPNRSATLPYTLYRARKGYRS